MMLSRSQNRTLSSKNLLLLKVMLKVLTMLTLQLSHQQQQPLLQLIMLQANQQKCNKMLSSSICLRMIRLEGT